MSYLGRVYKVVHNQSDIVYVGSTKNEIRYRWQGHKKRFNQWISDSDKKSGCSLYPYFKKFGIENFKIILIKEYIVCDKKHLESKEQLWINKLNCINYRNNINPLKKHLSDMHNREYYLTNKDDLILYAKGYRDNNREKINLNAKEYYLNNKEQIQVSGKVYRDKNKETIDLYAKEYRDKNKETIDLYAAKYRENNETNLRQKRGERVECKCGVILNRQHIARHRRSLKHLAFVGE